MKDKITLIDISLIFQQSEDKSLKIRQTYKSFLSIIL